MGWGFCQQSHASVQAHGVVFHDVSNLFLYQKRFLFPAILYHWDVYTEGLIRKVKGMKDIVWSGDGRFDSMGHSAKYETYSMFCFPIDKIVHF